MPHLRPRNPGDDRQPRHAYCRAVGLGEERLVRRPVLCEPGPEPLRELDLGQPLLAALHGSPGPAESRECSGIRLVPAPDDRVGAGLGAARVHGGTAPTRLGTDRPLTGPRASPGTVAKNAASPAAATVMCTISLVATPAVASSPAREPPRIPQPRTNIMSGPGLAIATVAGKRNRRNRC